MDHATHEHHAHQHRPHEHHEHDLASRSMAVSATLHCLSGCAIGEIAGLMIGTALGLANGWTIALSVGLAFLFGYSLSTLPLVRSGLAVGAALGVVLAADTLSIATMEVVDNAVMALIPGAMGAGLVDVTFWIGMPIALAVAFVAAYPVNRHLLARGKGHALTHAFHGAPAEPTGYRRFIPDVATSTVVAAIAAFLLGGLVVSAADTLGTETSEGGGHAAPTPVSARA
ncbi:DUF4396 domain-containing protein [Nocardioides abyssi]|uniref:DUF4396 domain-containing protein n=1 Tax=Nocardioides abyssi TaxID=3058370 RepID=A0ABT8EYQ8_9ACTN|nr:DUF4396 domain-containing protein [Nocardioides abyssi]MDN4162966.1 DUF4396 domain-containing protein [Nocardioides abyssi]